jgi:hypothetical protein
LALVIPSRAQSAKAAAAQDKIACLLHRVFCDRKVVYLRWSERGDEENAAQVASNLRAMKRPPDFGVEVSSSAGSECVPKKLIG